MFKKYLLLGVILFLALTAGLGYYCYRIGYWQQKAVSVLGGYFEDKTDDGLIATDDSKALIKELLGFGADKYYLFLFLNNTELRPGGGFIGVYAVVKMSHGNPEILKVEGTEILDNYAPADFVSPPPEALARYTGIKRLEFRDSNWWPDFASSSQKTMELYIKEKGLYSDKIDAIIALTPTVVEEILKISGPITYDGIEFNADNFTEKLEYEVEYGYKDKNLKFVDRKKIISGLGNEFIKKLALDAWKNWSKYLSVLQKMITQKQILAYSEQQNLQDMIEQKQLDGKMKKNAGDYIMWVDANLGALKTDASISRELSYFLEPQPNGLYQATVSMKYNHQGWFDWRTSRYRTYARLYVPLDSKLIGVKGSMLTDRNSLPGKVDSGIENGRQFFGTFVAVEPATSQTLQWQFYVSPQVAKMIKDGHYQLLVQKQLGLVNAKLTLGLNFGKNIVSAYPGEDKNNYGDSKFDYKTKMDADLLFTVNTN